ncbi:MAG: DNA repair protein RecO [Spirochaetota bacterium]|nr:DNA repair protein RecO [Spirochaetota bacterium]
MPIFQLVDFFFPALYPDDMERNVSSRAIVVHSQKQSQMNRRLTLLSVDFGLIEAISYGSAKSMRAPKANVFANATVYLYYNPVRDHYTLKDVAIIESNEHLRSEITLTYRGLFMAELIMKTHGGESELEYELLSQGLRFLQSGIADRVLIQFVLRLARILGVHADYEACPVCSRKYRDDETLRFTTDLLSPCCSECGSADLSLPPGARRYVKLTSTLEYGESLNVPLSETATARIKGYALSYAKLLAQRPLKTLQSGLL